MIASLPDWEKLSLKEQVAQMIVVRASGYLFDHQIQYPIWEAPNATLQHWIQTLGVGGVILLGGSAAELGLRSQRFQDWASVPLLIAADIEEGVGQRFSGATVFPPPMALNAIASHHLDRAIAYAQQMGAITAKEAIAIGINWLLAPVVDVNNNPANPVINVRAFGEESDRVSQLTTAFIQGAHQASVLTTAKHFPGHGDTAIDSHLELPVLPHSRERLDRLELVPFRAAIAAGVDAIMTAHLKIPDLDATYPATLSRPILTQELRQRLGFDGLIVTDALVMGAITDRYGANEAPVLAVEAGADIVLMPIDPEGAIHAICEAVETGRIPRDQISASLDRIWQAKQRVCFPHVEGNTSHAWEKVSPPIQLDALATRDAIATSAAMLRDSMQIHRPQAVRWQERADRRNVILVDDALNCSFLARHTAAIAFPQKLGYQLQVIDRHTPPVKLEESLSGARSTLLQLFIRGNPFRGSAGLNQTAKTWLHYLVKTNQLQALILYGSPYIVEALCHELPADVPYVFTYGQTDQAQAIALQSLFEEDAIEQDGKQPFTD